ncbi:MAG: hypothetical protein IJW38_00460 [Clostridia bacterium]|nr:hypothetical protein [Clostridia bacterium]
MASFFNQATLVFGGRRANSNVTESEIVDTVSLTKTAISQNYSSGGSITYAISIVNAGVSDAAGINLTDTLGAYELSGNTLYPLTYVDGSLRYFINGILQAAPLVNAGPPLTISGLNIPAGANALILYEARTNEFTPLAPGSSITNEITSQGGEFCAALSGTATVAVREEAFPVITKFASDETVVCGGEISYTFVLQNLGNTAVVATDNLTVEDVFNPILDISSVTLDGTALTLGTGYSYDAQTGEFATLPGTIVIPAASYEQDAETGVITTTPGVAVITVTGTIA